ncbi:hypothetical protein E2562_018083 [Oryza meyeriana var. granulata]|uniref:Uncharacterized protein n=1 Tax=Oryza meyeriana var. granulata TaxID=110450 RepID=A0A6G1CR46_9ORYZ|nr:hypothetical protein E2562_018083 [Oryza meyeriana var. granulata]
MTSTIDDGEARMETTLACILMVGATRRAAIGGTSASSSRNGIPGSHLKQSYLLSIAFAFYAIIFLFLVQAPLYKPLRLHELKHVYQ